MLNYNFNYLLKSAIISYSVHLLQHCWETCWPHQAHPENVVANLQYETFEAAIFKEVEGNIMIIIFCLE